MLTMLVRNKMSKKKLEKLNRKMVKHAKKQQRKGEEYFEKALAIFYSGSINRTFQFMQQGDLDDARKHHALATALYNLWKDDCDKLVKKFGYATPDLIDVPTDPSRLPEVKIPVTGKPN